jgi:hypothetical protein
VLLSTSSVLFAGINNSPGLKELINLKNLWNYSINKPSISVSILGTGLAPQQAFEKLLMNRIEWNYIGEIATGEKILWVQSV